MHANEVIESYVIDVARQLPRRQRNDVALELRGLLHDELAAQAAEQERAPDRAMAMQVLAGFGRPAETAARYRPRASVIDPADNHNLLIWALVGAIVLHGQAAAWLAWLGALLLIFAGLAWARRRWPARLDWRPHRVTPPDAASRWVFALCAALTLALPLAMYLAPSGFARVAFSGAIPTGGLALTDAFLASWQRGVVIACLLLAALGYAGVAVQGRFRSWSRWGLIGVNLVLGVLLVNHATPMHAWPGSAPFQVFVSERANLVAAPWFILAGGITVMSALYEAYRAWAQVRPAMPAQGLG